MWMNQYEDEELPQFFGDGNTPNLATGAWILGNLMDWTNSNSDGWPYWTKPSRAAKRLMEALNLAKQAYYRGTMVGDLTDAQLRAVLSPIKAFLTRQGVDAALVLGHVA
jgi:O-acetylhomoserine/O-acetylserine sulfhydrylase-like pyridoxal-dependent enzyme